VVPVVMMAALCGLGPATGALAMDDGALRQTLASGTVAPGPDGRVALDDLLAALSADAAVRLAGMPPGAPQVQSLTWPDGSLGCPQPGRVYTQALVPGYLVVFGASGLSLRYHASARGAWVLCPAALATRPAPDGRLR
jgi:hypothetical protein